MDQRSREDRKTPCDQASGVEDERGRGPPHVYSSTACSADCAGLGAAAALAICAANWGSQLEIAHQPIVVVIDNRKASRARLRPSGSRKISASVNGRLPRVGAVGAESPCS